MAKKAKPSARRVRGKKTSGRVSRIRTQKRSRAAPRRVRTASRRTTSRRVTRKPAASARPIKLAIQQVSRPAPSAPAVTPKESLGTFIGDIDHYFTHLSVGILEVRGVPVQVGDKIRIKGATTDFVQTVQSMQLDHQPVQRADKGKSVGLKVEQHVREHDKVYRL